VSKKHLAHHLFERRSIELLGQAAATPPVIGDGATAVRQVLWISDPANTLIVDANAASAALHFEPSFVPADCFNQFLHVGASPHREP
jgi:hypothetical protein